MNPLPYLPALVAAPARFSNPMRLREARKHLESAFAATNGRLAGHVFQQLAEGRKSPSAPWELTVFDCSAPWVSPRYQKTFIRGSLWLLVADAVTWIEDRTPELLAMEKEVAAAKAAQRPFHANTTP